MNIEVVPAYAIVDYVWALLKANTSMTESHYQGRVPIIPTSQQPEFTDGGKPFLVYAWSDNNTIDLYPHKHGNIAFAVYGATDRDIIKISNVLAIAFRRWDESAEDVNDFLIGTPFQGIRFTNFSVQTFEGPTPETQEGGRQSAVVLIRYGCIVDYNIITRL